MARIEVDQSGKVEQTQFDTRIGAVRLRSSSAVIIDRRLKRRLLSEVIPVRRKFKVLSIFASGVFLTIKPLLDEGDIITIDNEYPNQMKHVIRALHLLIRASRARTNSSGISLGNARVLTDLYYQVLNIIR